MSIRKFHLKLEILNDNILKVNFLVNLQPTIRFLDHKWSYKNDQESIYLNLLTGFKNSHSNRTDSQVFEFSRPDFVLIFRSRGRPGRKPWGRGRASRAAVMQPCTVLYFQISSLKIKLTVINCKQLKKIHCENPCILSFLTVPAGHFATFFKPWAIIGVCACWF